MTQGPTVVPVPIALYPEASPMTAFQNYFGSGLMGMTPAQMAQAAAENKSVLDFAAKGLTGLQAHVPKSQTSKVATGLDAIRQLGYAVAIRTNREKVHDILVIRFRRDLFLTVEHEF